jgi:hypothetical protein
VAFAALWPNWVAEPNEGTLSTPTATVLRNLEAYCRARQWAGFDPYDALNSEVFAYTWLARLKTVRLAFTQLLKRSPFNVRGILGFTPQQDAKATALFLMSYSKASKSGDALARSIARHLANRLLELRSPDTQHWCWGYSFPWQTRRRLVPRFHPNLVCTVFAANALLDAYETGLGSEFLTPAVSAGEYIGTRLYWSDHQHAGFAYPLPDVRTQIYNANFLGAALLCRLSKLTGHKNFLAAALSVARYSARGQREDGSWPYGLDPTHQWVDNFHTGYNLCSLHAIGVYLQSKEFDSVLRKGFVFYRDHFFTECGAPKYFHNRTYPIDIHCVAQSLITLLTLRRLDSGAVKMARSVLVWALEHMWDDRGFFYYRQLRGLTIRTSYMRWSQAWMLLALSTFMDHDSGF